MLECVLLDRDGTLNRERADYVKSWEEFEWLPGALDALRQLAELQVLIVVITNQSAVGRGIITDVQLEAIHRRMVDAVLALGGRLDGIFVCPHRPEDECDCRKPRSGLLIKAAAQYRLELANCILVGDTVTDWQAAQRINCPCLLVRTGRQGPHLDSLLGGNSCVRVVADLPEAVALIRQIGYRRVMK